MARTLYNTNLKTKRKPWQEGIIPIQSLSFRPTQKKRKKELPLKKLGIDLNEKFEEILEFNEIRCGDWKKYKENLEQPLKKRKEEQPLKKLGIDLNEKFVEIKKLFYKQCGKMCLDAGCEPEDVLQEVYKGILIRNKGTCPFDERKSAFSTYVVMVSRCVTTNYINKRKRLAQKETVGVEDTIEKTDYAIAHNCKSEDFDTKILINDIRKHLTGNLLNIFNDLLLGHNVSHISRSRGLDSRKIKTYIEKIKRILVPLGVAPC